MSQAERIWLLGACLFGLTLVVPLFVFASSTSWRAAFEAWKQFAMYMGGLYAIGLLTYLGMAVAR